MELFKLFGTIAIDNAEAIDALDETSDKAQETGKSIKGTGDSAETSESKFSAAFQKMGSGAAKAGKAIAAGLAVASAAVVKIGKDAISAYGDYEQLVGGVETLFKDSSDTVIQNAANAYKTAGLSANDYMETVTSFSASLLQSLGGDTVKASEKANTAITDMSDNANKMGTSMEAIQNAYQGFAKQNYTMLDNLKLGYGGTKEEMERLLEDASKISGIRYDVSSFSDITDAIHVVQNEMGITGTTAKEASATIQGSLSSAKSAWANLITGLADGNQDIGGLVENFFDTVVNVADNLVPRISQVLEALPSLITKLLPKLISKASETFSKLLPAVIKGAVSLLNAVVSVIPQLVEALIDALPTILEGIQEIFFGIMDALPSLIEIICSALPDLIPQLVEALVNMISYLCENFVPIIQPLLDALPDIIITLVDALMTNLPQLIQGVITLINALVQAMPEIIVSLIDALPTIIKSILQGLRNSWHILVEGLVTIVKNMLSSIWQVLGTFFAPLKEFFAKIWRSIKSAFSSVGTWVNDNIIKPVKKFFHNLWESIRNIFKGVANWFNNKVVLPIKNVFTKIWNTIKKGASAAWEGIKKPFKAVASWFKDIFSKAWQAVKNVFSKGGKVFAGIKDGIVNAFKKVVNAIIRGINKVIVIPFDAINKILQKIHDVSILGAKPFDWVHTFKVPQIPELAKGTVVENGARPAIIGENGAEAVVPLENHTGWIKNVATQLHRFNLETNADISGMIPHTGKVLEYQQQQVGVLDVVVNKLNTLLDVLNEYLPDFNEKMNNKQLVLDTGVLIGEIAPDIDKALGTIYKKKGRGNE